MVLLADVTEVTTVFGFFYFYSAVVMAEAYSAAAVAVTVFSVAATMTAAAGLSSCSYFPAVADADANLLPITKGAVKKLP